MTGSAVADDDDVSVLPLDEYCPTDALPGTEAKILVLIYRCRRRWPLWHPLDAKKGTRNVQPKRGNPAGPNFKARRGAYGPRAESQPA